MSKFESLCVNGLDLILMVLEILAVHIKALVNGGGLYVPSYGGGGVILVKSNLHRSKIPSTVGGGVRFLSTYTHMYDRLNKSCSALAVT